MERSRLENRQPKDATDAKAAGASSESPNAARPRQNPRARASLDANAEPAHIVICRAVPRGQAVRPEIRERPDGTWIQPSTSAASRSESVGSYVDPVFAAMATSAETRASSTWSDATHSARTGSMSSQLDSAAPSSDTTCIRTVRADASSRRFLYPVQLICHAAKAAAG